MICLSSEEDKTKERGGLIKVNKILSFLIVFIILVSLITLSEGTTLSATLSETIRRDLLHRDELMDELYTFDSGGGYCRGGYVEPFGIILVIHPYSLEKHQITEDNLNEFFEKFGEAFASTKYPPTVKFYIFGEIGIDDSLYIQTTAEAVYNYFKEKISLEEFLKQCEIWIGGVEATIEGVSIKTPTKTFEMNFSF